MYCRHDAGNPLDRSVVIVVPRARGKTDRVRTGTALPVSGDFREIGMCSEISHGESTLSLSPSAADDLACAYHQHEPGRLADSNGGRQCNEYE